MIRWRASNLAFGRASGAYVLVSLLGVWYLVANVATTVFLLARLGKPLLVEGPAGVGKTELAKALAAATGRRLLRLQCYEGLDVNQAVYEWNYTRQMMHIRLLEARGEHTSEAELFGPEFLLKRPLLQAIDAAHGQQRVSSKRSISLPSPSIAMPFGPHNVASLAGPPLPVKPFSPVPAM